MSTTVSAIDPTALRARLDRAREAAGTAGVDALLMAPGSDLRYLLGAVRRARSSGSPAWCCPPTGAPVLVVPKLEAPGLRRRADRRAGRRDRHLGRRRGPVRAGRRPARRRRRAGGGRRHACRRCTCSGLRGALPDAEQVLAGPIVRELRMRKDAAEIDALRQAGAAIDRVHARIGGVRCGSGAPRRRSGADIAAAIVEEGHTGAEFVIVGSGPNGASPHHARVRPGDRGGRRGRGRHRRAGRRGLLLRLAPAPTSSASRGDADVADDLRGAAGRAAGGGATRCGRA